MNHYFTDNRHLAENRKEISFRFWCITYSFISDNGVFSKDNIDFGTKVFLDTLLKREEMGNRHFRCWMRLWTYWYHCEKNISR